MVSYAMRAPCPACGNRDGILARKSGQATVRCAACGRFCYCAPKSELGERPAPTPRRAAVDAIERWAGEGLLYLDEEGLSRDADRDFVASLAAQYRDSGRLSARQWAAAVALMRRYPACVGVAP